MASVFSFYEEKVRNGLFSCLNREFRGSVGSPIPIYRLTKDTRLSFSYEIIYVAQKAVKEGAIADMLADQAIESPGTQSVEFPDEDIIALENSQDETENWIMRFDGASNALGHGIGVILINPDGEYFPLTAKLCFECTNNVAEYEACVMGLQMAIEMRVTRIEVYGVHSIAFLAYKENVLIPGILS